MQLTLQTAIISLNWIMDGGKGVQSNLFVSKAFNLKKTKIYCIT